MVAEAKAQRAGRGLDTVVDPVPGSGAPVS